MGMIINLPGADFSGGHLGNLKMIPIDTSVTFNGIPVGYDYTGDYENLSVRGQYNQPQAYVPNNFKSVLAKIPENTVGICGITNVYSDAPSSGHTAESIYEAFINDIRSGTVSVEKYHNFRFFRDDATNHIIGNSTTKYNIVTYKIYKSAMGLPPGNAPHSCAVVDFGLWDLPSLSTYIFFQASWIINNPSNPQTALVALDVPKLYFIQMT